MTGTGKMKKKFATGEASWYLTRKQALTKLQVNLRDFRRLCIMKGVYPREPIKRTRAQKGSTENKTLYYKKDIQFLLHEPMIWRMWDSKARHKKIQKSRGKGDYDGAIRLKEERPRYQLDHIVKERYPTFSDALNDMDDALTLCSLFAIMPAVTRISNAIVADCRRLTVEFMHYVIEARALRKAFISIKGYYFQADVQGHTINWVVPHHFVYGRPENVDMKVMSVFCEFYATFLGFTIYRLYHSLNLHYPPSLAVTGTTEPSSAVLCLSTEELLNERVAALNRPLRRVRLPEDVVGETADDAEEAEMALMSVASGEQLEKMQQKRDQVKRTQHLFDGFKFFIGREVPREPLVLVVRALGGQCSWDATCAAGSTYQQSDQCITHQISDRDNIGTKYTSRYYIQPQWVFDSLNAGQLRPVQLYFPGVELPPHLSPFKEEQISWGEYMPPDKLKLLDELSGAIPSLPADATDAPDSDSDGQDSGQEPDEEEADGQSDDGSAEESDSGMDDETSKTVAMAVRPGAVEQVDRQKEAMQTSREEFWLRAHMVKKKDRYKFNRLMKRKKTIEKEARKLTEKRKIIDEKRTPTQKPLKKNKGPVKKSA